MTRKELIKELDKQDYQYKIDMFGDDKYVFDKYELQIDDDTVTIYSNGINPCRWFLNILDDYYTLEYCIDCYLGVE